MKPLLSIIIPTRDRWPQLRVCLDSICEQEELPPTEIIIVDDGSCTAAPRDLLARKQTGALIIERQEHLGVSAARNRGAQLARGNIVVFIDSDCALRKRCLHEFLHCVNQHGEDQVFQLAVSGSGRGLVGRCEDLNFRVVQRMLETKDGHIGWLNTAAFGFRREWMLSECPEIFDTRAIRGEDTVLLLRLNGKGILPRYVPAAEVLHYADLSMAAYLLKAFHASRADCKSIDLCGYGTRGVLMSNTRRLQTIRLLYQETQERKLGLAPLVVILVRHVLIAAGRLAYRVSNVN